MYRPMLAAKSEASTPPRRGYVFEIKWDGLRAILTVAAGRARLVSRGGRDITGQFAEVARAARAQMRDGVYDLELVVLDEQGRASFAAANSRLHLGDDLARLRAQVKSPATAMVFDVLELEGQPLVHRPWKERRAALQDAVTAGGRVLLTEVTENGAQALRAARVAGHEGIMAKRVDAIYEPGRRSRAWLKLKFSLMVDVLVVGFAGGEGRLEGSVGALVITDARGRALGRVGSGLSDEDRRACADRFARIGTRETRAGVTYLQRPIRAEVQAMSRTHTGALREPVFRAFR